MCSKSQRFQNNKWHQPHLHNKKNSNNKQGFKKNDTENQSKQISFTFVVSQSRVSPKPQVFKKQGRRNSRSDNNFVTVIYVIVVRDEPLILIVLDPGPPRYQNNLLLVQVYQPQPQLQPQLQYHDTHAWRPRLLSHRQWSNTELLLVEEKLGEGSTNKC